MRERVIVFMGAALLLVASGYLVVRYLLTPRSRGASTGSSAGTSSSGSASTASRFPLADAASTSRSVAASAALALRSAVQSVEGQVERRRAAGAWEAARVGDHLTGGETLRTAARASTTLRVGNGSTVRVGGETEIMLQTATAGQRRLQLTRGRVDVRHLASDGAALEIVGQDGTATARGRGADFAVLQAEGSLSVAAREGQVDVRAKQQGVTVAAGQQSVVLEGRAPAPPTVIPKAVLLKIAQRALRPTSDGVMVNGRTQPGSRVFVAGQLVPVQADGSFWTQVPAPKDAPLEVVTEDALGRRQRRELTVAERAASAKTPGAPEGLSAPKSQRVRVRWDKQDRMQIRWGKNGDPRESAN